MPAEITDTITSIQTTLAEAPAAIVAIILLAGPTAAWIIYRLVVAPRAKRHLGRPDGILWICEQCRSANEVHRAQCYQCGHRRSATKGDLHVVDGEGLVMLPPLVPVGPGRPGPAMGAALIASPDDEADVAADATADVAAAFNAAVAASAQAEIVPVGPGRPEVSVPRRLVTSGVPSTVAPPSASEPSGDPAAGPSSEASGRIGAAPIRPRD